MSLIAICLSLFFLLAIACTPYVYLTAIAKARRSAPSSGQPGSRTALSRKLCIGPAHFGVQICARPRITTIRDSLFSFFRFFCVFLIYTSILSKAHSLFFSISRAWRGSLQLRHVMCRAQGAASWRRCGECTKRSRPLAAVVVVAWWADKVFSVFLFFVCIHMCAACGRVLYVGQHICKCI